MQLSEGDRLGPYEILAPIGAGGMAEVYLARDATLKRDVALKVLSGILPADSERVARFRREAELLASLNHPGIAHIYGSAEADGVRGIAIELVDGPELTGPLPINIVIDYARQMIEALEYAHDRGVIHRDLKPANVRITKDGRVKLLDFGLAKALEDPAPPVLDPENTHTLPLDRTLDGAIVGTPAYMAPEQVLGQSADRRSDIFSFGAVLYEMLAGERAFGGTLEDSIVSVLKQEPDWSKLPSNSSEPIRNLLARCLRKDRKQRLQAIGEARIILDSPTIETPAVRRKSDSATRVSFVWVLAAFFAVLAAMVSLLHFLAVPKATLPETRLDIVTPPTSEPSSFAASPDGRQIVFSAADGEASRLWLRHLDSAKSQPLAGTEGATNPFWSPDNRAVGFFAEGKLKLIDLPSGAPRAVAVAANRGGAWAPDGTILYERTGNSALFRVAASGGEPRQATTLDGHLSHRYPQFLPDGRHFIFYAQAAAEDLGVYVGSLDSPALKRLTPSDAAGAYFPGGWLLFFRGSTLMAQRFNENRGLLTGDPVIVADGVAIDGFTSVSPVSASIGQIFYRSGSAGQRQLTWFDRSGKALGKLGGPELNPFAPRLALDGRRLATFRILQGNSDIWLLDADRSKRFTFHPGVDRFPIWSPDGSQIVFQSNRAGFRNLYISRSDQAGSEVPLLETDQTKVATDWSRDGRYILFHSFDPESVADIWVLPMDGDRKPFAFLKTKYNEFWSSFSPDGRWVAYMSDESGRFEIYLRSFSRRPTSGAPSAVAGAQWQISNTGGLYPRWRNDGKDLYYIAPDGKLMSVHLTVKGSTLDPGTPIALFQTHGLTDPTLGYQYDASSDGRFLVNAKPESVSPITVIQNWSPGSK